MIFFLIATQCTGIKYFAYHCIKLWFCSVIICIFSFFRVPTDDPSGRSMIMPRYELHRIVQNSQNISKEMREMMENRAKEEKERAMVRICFLSLLFSFWWFNDINIHYISKNWTFNTLYLIVEKVMYKHIYIYMLILHC